MWYSRKGHTFLAPSIRRSPEGTRSRAVIYEPGVYALDVPFAEAVPFFFEEPGFGTEHARGQPLTVAQCPGLVPAAVQQEHRDRDLGHVEAPRGELRYTVVPGSFDAGRQGLLHGDHLVGEQRQVDPGPTRLHVQAHLGWRRRPHLLPR